MAKKKDIYEQALKDFLSANVKRYRLRRNWSQFTLASKMDISTNFLADIEAGNTWVSAQTLAKFAQAFEIEAFELLKPEKEAHTSSEIQDTDHQKALMGKFSHDLAAVLQDSIEKSLEHVKKQYDIC